MLKRYVTAAAAALGLLLSLASQAFGYAEYYAGGSYYSGSFSSYDSDHTAVYYQSSSGGNVGTINGSHSWALVRADSANLSLGFRAAATSLSATADTFVSTWATNRFMVSPGTSGLASGDTTTLQLHVRADGALHAEAAPVPGSPVSKAEAIWGTALDIYDYSIGPQEVASFLARGKLGAYSSGLSASRTVKDFWEISSNISPVNTYSNEGEPAGSTDYGVDTGMLTLEFDAIVGHILDIEASIDGGAYAERDAEAWADFSHSFAFGVTPQTPGVEIDWEIEPQAQTVPLPGALPLLGSGLLLLLARKRRKGGAC